MNIYIGNMSFDTTEDQLRQTFEGYGEVTSVKIITDRNTGDPRGFAFVEMAEKNEALKAITELNEKEVDGRFLKVSVAKPRVESGNRDGNNRSRRMY